ncbi:hypothetical protein SAMN05660649_04241 [Desulfotomaculum arcticum]|uniref:Uncharacterized protein n=1 Tax=Desulfotruncus arcticus DSM 17038 TaxID=1121424 RepID=A0A1I2Y587_9FIRM|nr:hypothetical protein [Desulfotruncus arcticus]SFH20762.1 hypothetical protein SAMN05660649_04241 [Desulfotomaculum arcticum] [Desulfotruncus arcticus DSM 17038]
MNLNEILNISNKCAANLNKILKEVESYSCNVNIERNDRIRISFALSPKNFVEYVKKYDLDFDSEVYSDKSCQLFVCLENVRFFTLIYFKYDEDEYFRKKREEDLEMVEQFLKFD